MQDGAADHDIRESIGERHGFHGFDSEIFGIADAPQVFDSIVLSIHTEYFVAFAQQVHKVATVAAACIEDSHARSDSPFE